MISYIRRIGGLYGPSGFLATRMQRRREHTECYQTRSLLPVYSKEQKAQILKVINENTIEQMLSYDITKARASRLYRWRVRNGPLQELGDILQIDGFGLKVVTKFITSLLDAADGNRIKGAKADKPITRPVPTTPFISPTIDEHQRLRASSSVAVRIGVTSVSWVRFDIDQKSRRSQITHWQHHELNERKLQLAELARRCLYVIHQIQVADCYVLEAPQVAQASNNSGSIDQQNVNIQKSQVSAIISYALMSRESDTNNIFFMRRFLAARLFNHLVGTERVSSEDAILAMMQNVDNGLPDPAPIGCLHFPAELRHMFSQQMRYQRDLLCQAVLLNLAFTRLVLFQDPYSIASVSRNRKGASLNE
ncbi:hypothetical protein KR018_011590 [Drosophila ironensis]|nr:hypothetical protein KR018_011590 [Drosophila ironensis]